MKHFAALLAYVVAYGNALDCVSECGLDEWSDNKEKIPNLIQDWENQDTWFCQCLCAFDAPAGFVDHNGGEAMSCKFPNTYSSDECVCGPMFGSGATTLATTAIVALATTLLI